MDSKANGMNIKLHKSLYEALVEARDTITWSNLEQTNQEIIAFSLDALRRFIFFCRNPTNRIFQEDLIFYLNKLNVLQGKLNKANIPFLLLMLKVKNLIMSNYRRLVPPLELQVEAECLVNTLESYYKMVENPSSMLASIVGSEKTMHNENVHFINFDSSILNFTERANKKVANMNKQVNLPLPQIPMQNFISHFAHAIAAYLIHCEFNLKYFYNISACDFKELPRINVEKNKEMTTVHELLQNTADVILLKYPKFYIPRKAVVNKLRFLYQELEIMKKRWEYIDESNYSVLGNFCNSIIVEINNFIEFERLVPSKKVQTAVTILIDALDSYIPFFSRSKKLICWYHTMKMFSQFKTINLREDIRDEINLLEAISFVAHCKYIPPEELQKEISALKVTLEKWKAQWNTEKLTGTSATTSKPPENTIESTTSDAVVSNSGLKEDNDNLIFLLRKIRSDISNYSEIPSRELETELDETVKYLQKCRAAWIKTTYKNSKKDVQITSKILEPKLALPSNAPSTPSISGIMSPPDKQTGTVEPCQSMHHLSQGNFFPFTEKSSCNAKRKNEKKSTKKKNPLNRNPHPVLLRYVDSNGVNLLKKD